MSDEEASGLVMPVHDAGNPPDVDRPTQSSEPASTRTALTARSPANGSASGASSEFAWRGETFADGAEPAAVSTGGTGLAHFQNTGLPP